MNDKILVSRFRGNLHFGEIEIDCYVLEDGRRVLSKRGAGTAIGLQSKGGSALWRTLSRKGVGSEISESARNKLDNPLFFKYVPPGPEDTPTTVHGIEGAVLIDIATAILNASRSGKTTKAQRNLVNAAHNILVSVAKVGIIALIDEATGFEVVRRKKNKEALQKILDQYLQENARKWAKTFPDDFWTKLIKVKGYPDFMALKRPSFVGHWVNDIIYDRLAPGIRKKLDELNPRLPSGRRKSTHHQHVTEDHGLPELKELLTKVMAYMDAAANNTQFMRMLNRGCARFGDTYEMPFDDTY